MENLAGQTIKGYELLERIGAGGFGAVYRAYQSTMGREVAVKIILPGYANQPDFIRRFEAEARLVARLEHLHIVPLYDYWRSPDGAYLVMRWLRGGSLKEALAEGPFGMEAAALLLDQVASALATAHANGIVHRDLKPSNILLDDEGNAYLADFGIAKDSGQVIDSSAPDELLLGLSSPEQARGEAVTPQADIYGLGVTLYETLTGEPPFAGISPMERLFKHINDPIPRIETLDKRVRDEINEVIQRATAKNPKHRYPDAFAMAAAFREAAKLSEASRASDLLESLTLREQEILRMIVEGHSNREIAQVLYIELSTVKWHIRQIYGKLGVRSRKQAVVRARELKILMEDVPAEQTEDVKTAVVSVVPLQPVNPYKGLRAFETADSRDFFGRETFLKKVLSRLVPESSRTPSPEADRNGERFLAIVGPSGSGKSSLVNAGLIPAFWKGAIPGSDRWFIVEMVPGARPLDELEVALIRVAADQAGNIRNQLERDRNGLLRAAELILPKDNSELLLVIDQFEELFTLVPDENIRRHFLDILTAAATDARSRVRIVITLRADFYDRPLHYPEFGRLIRNRLETVLPLNAEELERAILYPGEQVGVSFEPGLVPTIIDDVLYQPGALPLLQYALTELFEAREGRSLTRSAYETIGGTAGALARRAEELYHEQEIEGQEMIRQMFLRLVALEDDSMASPATRQRVPRSELITIVQDEELMDELIDAYATYRLLTLDHDPQSRRPTLDIAHEALLREWERLRGWLDESRADLRLRRQLARAAEEWHEAGQDPSFALRGARLEQFETWSEATQLALTRDEREYLRSSAELRDERDAVESARRAREARLERRAGLVLQALVVVFLLAAAISGWLALDANRNLARSESQRLAAEANNVLQRAGSAELAALLALRGLDAHYTPQADLALQRATATYVDSDLIKAPGGAFWPVMLPDNRYLRFTRNDPDGSGPPITEMWDLQSMERLWQTSEYVIPGYPYDYRNESADYSAVLAAALDDSELLLLDVETGEPVLTFQGISSPVVMGQISANGKILVHGVRDGDVHVWDMETGEELRRFSVGGGGYAREFGHELLVVVSPDSRLVTATAAGLTHVWDIESGEELHRFEHEHSGWFFVPQFTDDSRLLLAAIEPAISLWDLTTGEQVETDLPPGFEGLLSPDGRVYAQAFVGDSEQDVVLWEVATGRELHRLTGHSDGARPVAFLDGGSQIITWGWEGTARVWDVASGQELLVLAGHTDAIETASLSPDERYFVTTGQDATVRIWDLQASRHQDYQLDGARDVLHLSPDGRVALTVDPETGTAALVEADSFEMLHHLDFTLDPIVGGSKARPPFSSDGRMVLGASESGTILVYNVASGKLIAEHANQDDVYKHPVFVPGSHHIFAGGDRGAYLLGAESGEQLRILEAPNNVIDSPYSDIVAVSNDGRYGAMHMETANTGHVVSVWDLETGSLAFQSTHPTDFAVAFAFSKDSRYFAWGGTGNIAYVLDLHSGEEVIRLSHLDSVHAIDFSSDNQFLLTSTGGDGVILWDIESGAIIRRFFAGNGQAGFAKFVEDDIFVLYSTFEDGLIYRQPVSPDGLIESTCARLQRDLTVVERQVYELDDSPTCPEFSGS